MAKEPKQIVLIPELDNEQGQFQLELKTSKNLGGVIVSRVHGQFSKQGMITFEMFGDFSKTYARSAGKATQAFLDKHHRMTFTAPRVDSIIAEVKEFYAKKRAANAA